MKKNLLTFLSIFLHSVLYLGAESVYAQTACTEESTTELTVTGCSVENMQCDAVTWSLCTVPSTTRLNGDPIAFEDYASFSWFFRTSGNPDGVEVTSAGNATTEAITLIFSKNDVLDDSQSTLFVTTAAQDKYGNEAIESDSLSIQVNFEASFINALGATLGPINQLEVPVIILVQ